MITNITLTSKEKSLLQDQKSHEEICIQKYTNYANLTSDQELKSIFMANAQKEQEHYNMINQLLNGQVPQMSGGQSGQNGQGQQGGQSQGSQMKMGGQQGTQSQPMAGQQSTQMSGQQGGQMSEGSQMSGQGQQRTSSSFKASDKDLCTDMLMTEKYVSSTYNTAIFEFKDPQVRDVLNHIQTEEQKHGEAIFKYLESKGLYSTQ